MSKRKLFVESGQVFGRLTVVEEVRLELTPSQITNGVTKGTWGAICKCECDNEITVSLSCLYNGINRSCGCLKTGVRENKRLHIQQMHGLSKHPYYNRARGAIDRCTDPNNRDFKNWGGRGISVYPPWEDDIGLFITYLDSLGPCPAGWSLDRINNEMDYQPGNLKWSSPKEQANNRRKGKRMELVGDWVVSIEGGAYCYGSKSIYVCWGNMNSHLDTIKRAYNFLQLGDFVYRYPPVYEGGVTIYEFRHKEAAGWAEVSPVLKEDH